MDENVKNLWKKIQSGELDINNQEMFFNIVAKGFIYKLNKNLKLREKYIPHYILNTGDDIMYLEMKGQDHSIEPVEVSNEAFIYSQIPRCMVQPTGINIQTEQLTNPYAHGNFQVECDDMIYDFRSEFRRIPLTYNFSLKYYFDSFTDALAVIQQIITNLAFVNTFNVTYMGQMIKCSYNIPDSENTEYMMEFDGITVDQKTRTLSLELEVQTNLPVIYTETAIPANAYIKTMVIGVEDNGEEFKHIKKGFVLYPKDGMKKGEEGELSSNGKEIIINK